MYFTRNDATFGTVLFAVMLLFFSRYLKNITEWRFAMLGWNFEGKLVPRNLRFASDLKHLEKKNLYGYRN